jgi:hypothetical protein
VRFFLFYLLYSKFFSRKVCDVFALLIVIYSKMGQLALRKASQRHFAGELLCIKQIHDTFFELALFKAVREAVRQ